MRLLPADAAAGASGNRFLAVETDDGQGQRYILKRISAEWDWIMRATDDRHGREVLLWQRVLLDRLPSQIAHPLVACAVDGTG